MRHAFLIVKMPEAEISNLEGILFCLSQNIHKINTKVQTKKVYSKISSFTLLAYSK